jgi:hypothetical protein
MIYGYEWKWDGQGRSFIVKVISKVSGQCNDFNVAKVH